MNKGNRAMVKNGWGYALLVATVGILCLTLSPGGPTPKGVNLIPFSTNWAPLKTFFAHPTSSPRFPLWFVLNLLGNLVLFLPFGFFLMGVLSQTSLRFPAVVVILAGCVLSVGIEVMQLTIPTRATDIDDVIFNTISAGLGVVGFYPVIHLWQWMSESASQTSGKEW